MTSSADKPTGSTADGMDPLVRFGYNLLAIRQARKLSQEALADRAAIHRTQMTLLENGRRSPRLETLVRLAGALEVPIDMLVQGIRFVPRPGGGELVATRPPELPRFNPAEGSR